MNSRATERLGNAQKDLQPRTEEELAQLKYWWEEDNCPNLYWNLYEREGFGYHRDELRAHQEQKLAEWEARREREEKADREEAERMGCPSFPALGKEVRALRSMMDYAYNRDSGESHAERTQEATRYADKGGVRGR